MRELNLDQLRTLVTIAELGSFAAAARVLHLGRADRQPACGRAGVTPGGSVAVAPAPARGAHGVGQTLIERARRLLADVDAALDEVARTVEGRAGRVRLGASTGALAWLLPQALETMRS